MKLLVAALIALNVVPAMAQQRRSQPSIDRFFCHQIDVSVDPARPVRNGLRMTVVARGMNDVREGRRFPVQVEVRDRSGVIFSGQVAGVNEDVSFGFVGTQPGARFSGHIYLDELYETSMRLHRTGQPRLKANMDCRAERDWDRN